MVLPVMRITRDDLRTIFPFAKTYTLPNDTSEHIAVTISPVTNTPSRVEVHLDLSALTQANTISLKEETDGTNPRVVNPVVNWDPTMSPDVMMGPFTSQQVIQITVKAGSAEGATRDIPIVVTHESDVPALVV